MAYKLLIEFDIAFESPVKKFLRPNEVIRCEPIKITLFVTNLGRGTFPGGKTQNWRITYGEAEGIFHTSTTANVDCGPIAPNEKVRLLSEEIMPMTDGIAWIKCKIDPIGEDKAVTYYQDTTESVEGEEWMNCFYVANREILLLLSAIEELTNRLH